MALANQVHAKNLTTRAKALLCQYVDRPYYGGGGGGGGDVIL